MTTLFSSFYGRFQIRLSPLSLQLPIHLTKDFDGSDKLPFSLLAGTVDAFGARAEIVIYELVCVQP